MSIESNESPESKGAKDKIHGFNLGEEKGGDNLAYDKDKNSFEIDVNSEDKEYDHPFPYETGAANGADFDSTYDEANPLVGDEYALNKEGQVDSNLDDLGMRLDDGSIVELEPEDEFLSRTPEDDRDDLDEEGYPINDRPLKP